MEIITAFPPNIDVIRAYLPATDQNVFSYFPDIYNPSGKKIEDDLRLHEEIHLAQQEKIGVDNWWYRYLTENDFRLEQEIMAFGAQYAYGLKAYQRKISDEMLDDFSRLLSGEMYGNLLKYHEANTMVRHKAKEYE